MQIRTALLPAFGAASFIFCVPVQAQAPDGQWHYLVQPYLMFPNMRGETGIANVPLIPVDEDPQDIFDNLQMGAMFYAEARNDTWTFSTDLLYMELGSDVSGGSLITSFDGDINVSQLGWEIAAMRRLSDNFELGLGVTYNQIDVDVDVTFFTPGGSTDFDTGLEEDWIDPTIVARAAWPIGDKWFFQARGNVGGFGVGSELMWQVMVDVGYRPSDKWFFAFGYRIIDIDYDQGSGLDRFVYDMQTFGPQLKVGFNF